MKKKSIPIDHWVSKASGVFASLLTAAGVCAAVPSAGSGPSGILFEEDFSNYNDAAPNIAPSEDISYTSSPIYERCGWVNATLKADADLFLKPLALPAKNAFDFLFTCELSATNSAFDVVFTDAAGGKTVVPFTGKGRKDVAFKADGRKLSLLETVRRRYTPVKAIDLAGELKTVNCRIKAGGQVRITKIVIRTPAALPANDALEQFPSLSVLTRPLAGAKASDGAPLDLTGRSVSFVPGATGVVGRISIVWDVGVTNSWQIAVEPERFSPILPWGGLPQLGIKANESWHGPDAVINFGVARQFVRPHLKPYVDWYSVCDLGVDIVRDWEKLPPASKHVATVEVRETDAHGFAQLWIDGSYAATFATSWNSRKAKRAVRAFLTLEKGVQYRENKPTDPDELQLAAHPKAKAFAGVAPDSADVALAHYAMGNYAMTEDGYTLRTALDGYPAEVRFRLPAAPYAAAKIRFVLDDAPGKVPYLITRLAKYRGSGTGFNEIEDAVLDLTKGIPESVRKVGSLRRGGRDYPVYETKIGLPLGKCLDLAAGAAPDSEGDFIDLEFTGPCEENLQQCDNRKKPRKDVSSAFNLLSVKLEKLNVLPEIVQLSPGNVFTVDEERKATCVKMTALVDNAKGVLKFGGEAHPYALAKKGDVVTNTFDFSDADVGLYRTDLTVECGAVGMTHEIVYCVTPEAGREVSTTNSPYCTWWFTNAHGSPSDPDIGCPMLEKAGIKRIQALLGKKAQEKYPDVLFAGFINTHHDGFDFKTGKFKPQGKLDGEAAFVKSLQDQINRNPYVNHLMVWHESAPSCSIPEELLGIPVTKDDAEREQNMAKFINEVGRICRKHFPRLKIQIGNTGSSIGATVVPLRGGAKADYYDAIGIETPSETVPPERLLNVAFLGQNIAQAAAKKITGRDLRTNGAFEFIYRCVRDLGADGEHVQAEFHTRDLIISLMHGYTLISPGLFFDCRNAYCNTVWGPSGIVGRGPFVYPKKAYLAYAVLTKELDGVTFVREIPTGSPTVYAAEFRRPDGRYATAFWCARGEADLVCDRSGELCTMYGGKKDVGGWFSDAEFAVSTSPSYLIAKKPIETIAIAARRFPADAAFAAQGKTVTDDFSLANVTVAPDPDLESRHTAFTPILKPGVVTAKDVADPVEGKCLELTLDTDAKPLRPIGELVTEYTTVRLNRPVEIPGVAGLLGLRVKGDSGWGQIRFEIEDAKGEVFKGLTTGRDWACDIYDWPGYTALSFDGWGDVYQYTDRNCFDMILSPGPRDEQWVSATGGDKKIQFPVKLRAVSVSFNRHRADLLGFTPVRNPSVRIKRAWAVPAP